MVRAALSITHTADLAMASVVLEDGQLDVRAVSGYSLGVNRPPIKSVTKRSDVPSRKEIQWSQLKVGALVLVAMAVLIGLIFLMSGSTGGLFATQARPPLLLRERRRLKDGAPVTLEGVTIGNVHHIRVVPARNPTPVEVTMEVGDEVSAEPAHGFDRPHRPGRRSGRQLCRYRLDHATGPAAAQQRRTQSHRSPSIQDVIRSSQVSIEQINEADAARSKSLVDSLNSRTRNSRRIDQRS